MAINLVKKQQILFDSFEMFKDDWESNSTTLISTIAQVAEFDVNTAIQMWIYLLKKHSKMIKKDSDITSGILNQLSDESYLEIAGNDFLVEKLFKQACNPWNSISLICHYLIDLDYYTANKFLDLISNNVTVSEYNYTDYKSSNLSTCLYLIIDRLYNFEDDDIEFFSGWIEHISDKNEKMKLQVLMISKEKGVDNDISYNMSDSVKNDYLLENASLEDLDLASNGREEFEIKKLISSICNQTICDIDFSRLDISWVNNIFIEQSNYTESDFNLIGAYFFVYSLSWETENIIKNIYKDKMTIKSIVSYSCETEATIRQRIRLVTDEINQSQNAWDFKSLLESCDRIKYIYEKFNSFYFEKKNKRRIELDSFSDVLISTLGINTRITNLLSQNDIFTFPQLVDMLDEGKRINGIGDKSLKILFEKVAAMGVKLYTLNDDLNFLFEILGIGCNANKLNGIFDIEEKLKLPRNTLPWNLGRKDLKLFLENQFEVAKSFATQISNSNLDKIGYMSLLRKDDNSIFLPGKYFFYNASVTNIPQFF